MGSPKTTGDLTHSHYTTTMETVAIKDIPREMLIGATLKDELLGDRNLRPTEAAEKNVLPTAEDVKSERSHRNILSGIEAFKSDALKHAETKEKLVLPGAEEIQTEKTIQGLLQGVEGFEAEKLRSVKTRQPASPSSILQVELARDSSLTAVNEFDKTSLKPAETAEKIRCRHQKTSNKKWSTLSSRLELRSLTKVGCLT